MDRTVCGRDWVQYELGIQRQSEVKLMEVGETNKMKLRVKGYREGTKLR